MEILNNMEIKNLLIEKKETILDKWIDQALATYPVEGYKIFKSRKDQFANPV
ncbi:MAG: RsbRD N-terminal domain-containing protein, partial [Desulfobulbaceae bacterium]|nr:RsbRD N-terminal domain-containing protein [Desulfobulbaceae bacterium]